MHMDNSNMQISNEFKKNANSLIWLNPFYFEKRFRIY